MTVDDLMALVWALVNSGPNFHSRDKELRAALESFAAEHYERGRASDRVTPESLQSLSKKLDEMEERLRAERHALRADAERGRFLCDWMVRHGLLHALRCQPEGGMAVGDYWVLRAPAVIDGNSCDGYGKTENAAIDAAMADNPSK